MKNVSESPWRIRLRCVLRGLIMLALLPGCGDEVPAPGGSVPIDVSKYLLPEVPEGARSVKAIYESSTDKQDVVIEGKIGGRVDPWVEGRAAFEIVDVSLKSCSDIPGDDCPTPWDYCCVQDELSGARALVKVVGADGKPLAGGAKKLFKIRELQTVVVRGTVRRDDKGNLTVLAHGLFVRE
ncbi:MAG: hypothetical protein VB859_12705 [Planctomycetaceae bacterium]